MHVRTLSQELYAAHGNFPIWGALFRSLFIQPHLHMSLGDQVHGMLSPLGVDAGTEVMMTMTAVAVFTVALIACIRRPSQQEFLVRVAEMPAQMSTGNTRLRGDLVASVVRACTPKTQLALKTVSRSWRDAVRAEIPDWMDSYAEMVFVGMVGEMDVVELLSLETLVLPRPGMVGFLTRDEGKGIGALLRFTSSLRRLCLSRNQLGDAGVVYLAAGLRQNATLHSLMIDSNEVGDEGALAIADSLRENRTLTHLSMAENGVGPEVHFRHPGESGGIGEEAARVAKAFVDALEINKSLRFLSLASCELGDEGAKVLAAAFRAGKISLTDIDLRENEMSHAAKEELRAAAGQCGHKLHLRI